MPTAAEAVRDDLIAQDVRYRRADAAVRRQIDARFDKLEADLKILMLRIDAAGTQQVKARRRRIAKLEKESKVLIKTAFTEINGYLKGAMRQLAHIETKATATILRTNIP